MLLKKGQGRILHLFVVLLLLAVLPGCGGGNNDGKSSVTYPTKPINMIVPYAPGGSSDMSARPIADQIGASIGQPMVVVNKAGAGGSVGAAEVARAKGDGYTLLNASVGPITIVPYTSKVGYDYTNFKAVAQITDIPLCIAVKADSPFQTLQEYFEYAKKNPGKVRYGSPGVGNIQHVAMESVIHAIKVDVKHMPYEGANPAVAALLGGHVESTFTGISEVVGHYKSGAVRILGVTSGQRISMMPDLKTFKEQGYDFEFGLWYGILVPKDTADDIVKQLAEAFKTASDNPKVIEAWEKLYVIPAYLGPEEFSARIKKDAESNAKILKEIGMSK